MRNPDPAILTAIAARRLRFRDFLDITAHDRVTDAPVRVGFWSGVRNVSASVMDIETGLESVRDWYGMGSLISISDIPLTIGISTDPVTVRMSQLDDQVSDAVRLYDTKMAKVEIYRGWFDPVTALMVAPAETRFYGFVDEVRIVTPKEGEDGYVDLICMPSTIEMFRANPATRSNADQQLRHAGDDFFIDAATIADWGPVQWGPVQAKVDADTGKKGLLGWGGWFFGL